MGPDRISQAAWREENGGILLYGGLFHRLFHDGLICASMEYGISEASAEVVLADDGTNWVDCTMASIKYERIEKWAGVVNGWVPVQVWVVGDWLDGVPANVFFDAIDIPWRQRKDV